MVSEKLETVGHIPREISSHIYFYIKEEGRRIDGSALSTRYRPSPVPRLLKVQGISHIRKWRTSWRNFIVLTINQLQNVELDSDSDEIHIEIKENVVEESEDSKVVVAPKVKMGKVTFAYNSDDSDEEKEKTQKKTTFENDSDGTIPEGVSK